MSVFSLANIKPKTNSNEQKPWLLLVDDEAENLSVLSHLLTEAFNVLTADNPDAALELLENTKVANDIKVVLCDLQLQPVSGTELLNLIHTMAPNAIGILLSSTHINQQDYPNGINLYGLLNKPVEPQTLVETVQKAVETYHQRQALIKLTNDLTMDIQVISEQLAEKKLTLENVQQDLARLKGF